MAQNSSQGQVVDVPQEDYRTKLRDNYYADEKDKIIARQKEELDILRSTLETNQRNYQNLSDDNRVLINYIKDMNAFDSDESGDSLSFITGSTPKEAELETEKKVLENELSTVKTTLKSASDREVEIKSKLDLPLTASQQAVLDKIHELKMGTKVSRERLKTLEKNYEEVVTEKILLQEKVEELEGRQSTIELRGKQIKQDADQAKHRENLNKILKRQGTQYKLSPARIALGPRGTAALRQQSHPPSASSVLGGQTGGVRVLGLPGTGTGGGTDPTCPVQVAAPGGPIPMSSLNKPSSTQRCVLCREAFPRRASCLESSTHCHIHYHVFKDGSWACCGGGHDATGCLKVPHLRVELTKNNILLTDGAVRTVALN